MRYFFLILISFISLLILWINIKLYSENYNQTKKKADILLQLNFLEAQLKDNNLGDQMQELFPEGFVFINALYGLSWCELALSDSQNSSALKKKAVEEALYAYNNINSQTAKWNFDGHLIPEYGIYYFGWKNYLLSKILSVDTKFANHKPYIDSFNVQCDILKDILKTSETPYLQSYSGQTWPADMFVAMASLSNHDKVFNPKFKNEINNWIQKVKDKRDPDTHMIPHKVDSTGKSIQGTRGCSMSLILRMLAEINSDFANEQFKLFKKNFVTTTLGLPSVREYPKGKLGLGDIDSGPVILGVGFSATIVMMGTFSMYDCDHLAEQQYKTINAFGFSNISGEQKRYLFGQLPMADAFISWGRATELNYHNTLKKNQGYWRSKFHIISFLIIILIWATYNRKRIFNRIVNRTEINGKTC